MQQNTRTFLDPVCGMQVNENSPYDSDFHDQKYYFCSEHCLHKFQAHPEAYLNRGNDESVSKNESYSTDTTVVYTCPMHPEIHHNHPDTCPKCGMGLEVESPALSLQQTEYVCPMHPEVIQDHPGSCPKCGMALEPTIVSVEQENPELIYMSKRFWFSLILAVPVLVLAMIADMVPGWLPDSLTMQSVQWIEFAMATPVVLWGGWPFFVRAVQSLRGWNLNMFTLIGMGVTVSWVFSVVALLFPHIFPLTMRHTDGTVSVYFEAAAVITTLVLLGQVLELRARSRTNEAIQMLLGLAPNTARIHHDDGREEDISLEHVRVGDVLRIRPGEKVPVDGCVIDGESNIDESMVTGEPTAVAKKAEDQLIGATINGTGSLLMRAEKVGADTLLAQIVNMVAEAQRTRAPIQKLADVVSGYFVPTVVIIAMLSFGAWYVLGPEPRLAYAVVNAVAVLIIACPCALGLATPISIMVGTGQGATAGVLIKNAEALEVMEKVDTLVVDKTGTLTEGKPRLVTLMVEQRNDENEILRLAASLERSSEHPLAESIVEAAANRGLELSSAESFESVTGKGVVGQVQGRNVVLGNIMLLQDFNIDTKSLKLKADELGREGQTVMLLAIDNQAIGLIGVADPVKRSTPAAIKDLHSEGVEVVMLTGDNRTTAEAVAEKLNIDRVEAEVLPDQKAMIIKNLQGMGKIVAMAGDGINDAPALAQAHVGLAMGTGTDVAMESAAITLVKGDLRGIVRARRLSRATMRNIKQNLFFAFAYNSVGVPIAAGLLYPFWGLLLSPMIAAVAMSFSSVSVIGNALRLRKIRL